MTRSIALLRGVNVGGRNKLPMKLFVGALEGLGCENVRTYIQSGNAVYDGKASAGDVAAAVKKAAGFTPHVFVLTAAAFRKAATANPFARQAAENGKSVHLFLLDAPPTADAVEALGAMKRPREDFAIGGRTLYLYTPDGLAVSKVAERIDRVLGVKSTARNWNTVGKLIELAGGA